MAAIDPFTSLPTLRTQTDARAPRASRIRVPPLDIAIPATIIALISIASFGAPYVSALPAPIGGNPLEANLSILSAGHGLGTDTNGNDVLARLLHGGKASLQIAIAVNLVGLVLGGSIGALGAYLGSWVDSLIARFLDVLLAFPSLILIVAIAQGLEQSQINTVFALAFYSVPTFARIARAETLRLREQPFLAAAQLCGTGLRRVIFRHIGRNILPQLTTFALLGMGSVIMIEGAISYLGLGVPLPEPSWGNMIFQGQATLAATPRLVILPSAFLFVTVLSFNLLGEAMRARCRS